MKDDETLPALEKTWAEAPGRGDLATVSRVVADDWVGVGPRGQTMTKGELLEILAARPGPFDQTNYSDVRLSRFDTPAIVTSLFHGVGEDLELKQRLMRVYAKREGQWRCVATQIVALPEELT